MYRQFFGLKTLPFKITPELEMFYRQGSRQQILEALLYTIARGDGIIKVTGEVGSGKTMLLRLLASKLPSDTEIIYINSPNLSAKDILLYICNELKIDTRSFNEKFSLTNALQSRLLELHAQGKRVVMLIDEAQAMTFDALEEIRLFSNLETSHDKLIQIVLFGQPELDVAMENEKVRQIKSRISYSIYVPPLKADEVYEYLNYRMRQAGYTGLDVFDKKISKRITKLSSGLPRKINVIADKALMSAFGLGEQHVKPKHLTNIDESDIKRRLSPIVLIFVFIFTLFLGLLGYFYSEYQKNQTLLASLDKVANHQEDTLSPDNNAIVSKNIAQTKTQETNISNDLNSSAEIEAQQQKTTDAVSNTDDVKSAQEAFVTEVSEANLEKTDSVVPNRVGALIQEIEDDAKLEKIDIVSPDKVSLKKVTAQSSGLQYAYNPSELKEPFKSLHFNNKLQKLLKLHQFGVDWLSGLSSRYVLQLSTRNISRLEETLEFYEKYKINGDSVKILIDFNPNVDFFRIKVFSLPSDGYLDLSNQLENLPEKIKRDGPYIVKIETLKNKQALTEQKLKEVGITNDQSE